MEGHVGPDLVVVAAAIALTRDVAGGDEIADDAVRGSFGDPDPFADLAQAGALVIHDAEQYLSVVGEKRPLGPIISSHKR